MYPLFQVAEDEIDQDEADDLEPESGQSNRKHADVKDDQNDGLVLMDVHIEDDSDELSESKPPAELVCL